VLSRPRDSKSWYDFQNSWQKLKVNFARDETYFRSNHSTSLKIHLLTDVIEVLRPGASLIRYDKIWLLKASEASVDHVCDKCAIRHSARKWTNTIITKRPTIDDVWWRCSQRSRPGREFKRRFLVKINRKDSWGDRVNFTERWGEQRIEWNLVNV
jgi:hypothetical protein